MTRKSRRLTIIGCLGLLLAVAVGLVLAALEEGITFFSTPSEIASGEVADGQRLRLGGLVEAGSVERQDDGAVAFKVTDQVQSVPVTYVGLLPDLFREGQGVVAEGRLVSGVFEADTVLARHDETYVPKEVADALKASGQWRPEMGSPEL
ncbi:MAG: cytochrome c maturation protein CcmE [Pseudomonadota bacterium]